MSTLGYRQGSGEAIPAIIHPSYVAGGQTWTVLSGVKKDALNTVHVAEEFTFFSIILQHGGLRPLPGIYLRENPPRMITLSRCRRLLP